ncbi:hypothetical protein [Streptomyces scabichelini]|nr:hypothetical protein [Streptomyces scabichelini]
MGEMWTTAPAPADADAPDDTVVPRNAGAEPEAVREQKKRGGP